MEMLMEKIRSKATQYKSFTECAKMLRMSQLEKRFAMDVADRSQLQKCLDIIQQSMKVNTLQGMVERLESISRQLSLKLMAGQTGLEIFISSDMFYLEVSLEPTGCVKDVKIHHEGKTEQQSCEELVKSLSKGDLEDFTNQLEGLISIYQLNAEKKVKCKAFSALSALEADLDTLWCVYCATTRDVQTMLYKSPVGILERRKGGHPMKLTYLVTPYNFLETKKEPSIELINSAKLGLNVTICLEGSAAHKLQTVPLISVTKAANLKSPVYASPTPSNSATLPAFFTLKLNKPQPVCIGILKLIESVTELESTYDYSTAQPLLGLIIAQAGQGKVNLKNNKGLFVSLPDMVQCYFLTECKGLEGIIVSTIPFTHPSHVEQILTLLRQQAVLNELIASTVRINSKEDLENMVMLELSALSWKQLSVSFEHPLQESMSTMEIDLSDVGALQAKLYSSSTNINMDHLSAVLQRCLSVPVTMRYLIKTLQRQAELSAGPLSNGFSSAPNGGLGNGGGGENQQHEFGDPGKAKHDPSMSSMGGNLNNGRSHMTHFGDLLDLPAIPADQARKRRKHDKQWKATGRDGEITMEVITTEGLPKDLDLEADIFPVEKDQVIDVSDLDEVEEMLKVTAAPIRTEVKVKKVKEPKRSPSLHLSENKGVGPPSVTITPIPGNSSASFSSVLSGIGLEGRPGIEIIPLSNNTPTNLPSSITITPITTSDKDDRKGMKMKTLEDKLREKKRKRKREEECKMGPPEKVPAKADPLSKPVSVSIKPASDSPPGMPRPSSPSMRKYTTSPTQMRDKQAPPRSHPSPKHSPGYGSSPKHNSSASPKHGTSSPKQTSGSSGKPSMSALKSASNSPNSSKSSEMKVKSGEKPRDKDSTRKSSGNSSGSPKIKSSSVKLKQLDLSADLTCVSSGSSTPPNCTPGSGNPLQRNRKGSLSAVIDKLKSAQEVSEVSIVKREGSNNGSKEVKPGGGMVIGKVPLDAKATGLPGKLPEGMKNPTEYMVKRETMDGMKITINKTRTKDGSKPSSSKSSSGSSSSSSSGSGSPKTHTGLKPGVSSGPASKKLQVSSKSLKTTTSSKPSSSLKSSTSLSKSVSKSAADLSRKENMQKSRPKPDKMVFKDGCARKGSPAPSREEEHYKTTTPAPCLVVEGLTKPFDTKFQIPKLSARNANPSTTPVSTDALGPASTDADDSSNNNNIKREDKADKSDVKVVDLVTSKPNLDLAASLKYQTSKHEADRLSKVPMINVPNLPNLLSLPIALNTVSPKLPMTSPNLPTTSLSSITSKLDRPDDKLDPPTGTETETDNSKEVEFQAPKVHTEESTLVSTPHDAAQLLLDFSTTNKLTEITEKTCVPVLTHSPLTFPSPRTPQSITDDELMDEALKRK